MPVCGQGRAHPPCLSGPPSLLKPEPKSKFSLLRHTLQFSQHPETLVDAEGSRSHELSDAGRVSISCTAPLLGRTGCGQGGRRPPRLHLRLVSPPTLWTLHLSLLPSDGVRYFRSAGSHLRELLSLPSAQSTHQVNCERGSGHRLSHSLEAGLPIWGVLTG